MAKRILRMKNGSEHAIISETGKYYICEGTQLRKMNAEIDCIYEAEEKKAEVKDDGAERESGTEEEIFPEDPAPKKKKSDKKKKKDKAHQEGE